MKWVYKIIRALIVTAIVLVLTVPLLTFIALSIPNVQNGIRNLAERQLSEFIDMKVSIGNVNISPFTRLTLRNVEVIDKSGSPVIEIERLGGALNLTALIFKRTLVMDYAELIGLNGHIGRENSESPLNIQPLIDAFAPKKPHSSKKFEFRINTIVIRKSSLSYDIWSEPEDSMKFDRNHIDISDLRADLRLPMISNENIEIIVRRLAFNERSGLRIKGMDGEFRLTGDSISLDGFSIRLPDSELSLSDIHAPFDRSNPSESLKKSSLSVGIQTGSHIYLPDIASFLPVLSKTPMTVDFEGKLSYVQGEVKVENLLFQTVDKNNRFSANGNLDVSESGKLSVSRIDFPALEINIKGEDLLNILAAMEDKPLQPKLGNLIRNIGFLNFNGSFKANKEKGWFDGSLSTDPGRINFDSEFTLSENTDRILSSLTAKISAETFELGELTDGFGGIYNNLGAISFNIDSDLKLGKDTVGSVGVEIESLEFKRTVLTDIQGKMFLNGNDLSVDLMSENRGADFTAKAQLRKSRNFNNLKADVNLADLDLSLFGNSDEQKENELMAIVNANLGWSDLDDITGNINISDVNLIHNKRNINISEINLHASSDSLVRTIELRSDLADGELRGNFRLTEIASMASQMMGSVLPVVSEKLGITSYEGSNEIKEGTEEYASLSLVIKTTDPLGNSFDLPLAVIYPVDVTGDIDFDNHTLQMGVNAPYLQQKNKLLENTALKVEFKEGGGSTSGLLSFSTLYPTKKGAMTIGLDAYAIDDMIDTHLAWRVNRERDFHGDLSLSSVLKENGYRVRINPTELVFNDTVWQVSSAVIEGSPEGLTVDNLRIGRENQFISIAGRASKSDDDVLKLKLQDVNLDYIFETLDIETAMFGGIATGEFIGSSLFSPSPSFGTPGLKVDNLKYNNSLMGNADIKSAWDNEKKSVSIDALIHQPNTLQSKVLGEIFPFADSLDFHFDADKIEVGFMLPYMSAFTSQVSGYASGEARLWGNFKYIDMVGKIYAEDLKLKLDFTNTSYLATDTVVLTPGHIDLRDIILRDTEGKTALLNGYIDHEFFKKPRFEFRITEAEDMLVYDIPESPDLRWFGKIYGNGGATITGAPGIVNIGVNMSTAPRSSFTFVLSDAEEAYEYNFITFRDRDQAYKDSINALNRTPDIVRELRERINKNDSQGGGSIYTMNIAVDVNPSAQVNIIMDPVGGDRIRCYGEGNLRMTYESANEDFKMYGTYTLARGSYNFTLQDIIIKDFTIRDGSSITFQGDPYAALLDIEAVYSVNANLSDLDESFLQDKELNRTNVPVHALLQVKGDIRQPDISFDLEFPTLTQDIYRKVKSIVSTEEMMNRQIIYLLALSRFYTPDYMTTTKGNELVSVASSTISSQLSNILGQLSENWSIAPNIRSNKGDFSDVEVDVALSSSLLNNRLLLNGNFGYRDKSLNSNTFIGDFDIEYLLNRTGSVRLKAYNRYNDRTYYLKSALTTQGVGVVFKRDFDDMFSFLKKKSKTRGQTVEPKDTLKEQVDSGPTIIFTPIITGSDAIPSDTILNKGRFQIDLDNL